MPAMTKNSPLAAASPTRSCGTWLKNRHGSPRAHAQAPLGSPSPPRLVPDWHRPALQRKIIKTLLQVLPLLAFVLLDECLTVWSLVGDRSKASTEFEEVVAVSLGIVLVVVLPSLVSNLLDWRLLLRHGLASPALVTETLLDAIDSRVWSRPTADVFDSANSNGQDSVEANQSNRRRSLTRAVRAFESAVRREEEPLIAAEALWAALEALNFYGD